ncbi:MAG: AAA family ATPase [Oscillospiraceae bacterium]|nr:AAA family ATPase [Oscillospiraceae bacterium]
MAVLTTWAQAQYSVIGSLLRDPDECAGEIFQTATPAMFGDKTLRHVFEAAREIWSSGVPVDPVTLGAKAGKEYSQTIVDCVNLTPTAVNAGAYLKILREQAQLNAMQVEALSISTADTVEDATESYEKIGKLLAETEDIEDYSLTEMIGMYLDRMNDPTPPDYLHFGMDRLDSALAVTPGMFLIIGADSSTGKTALALQFAVHIARNGKRVGFFSLETPQEPLQNRIMAEHQLAGIPVPSSQQKKLSDEDFARAAQVGILSENIPLRVIRKANTLEKIRARTLQRRFDVIFIDYVQLIDAQGKERFDVVTKISMGLHRMAQELGVVIVGLSQVTPPEKGKKVKITVDDLRESRQLKQDADIVLLMTRSTDKDDPPEARILEVAKNKDGRRPKLRLNFDPQHMTFTPLITMDDIRSDGRTVRQQQEVQRKAKEKADKIPPDAKSGKMVELDEDLEDIPF